MILIISSLLLLFNLLLLGIFELRYIVNFDRKKKLPNYKDIDREILLPVIIPVKNEDEDLIIKKIEYLNRINNEIGKLKIIFIILDDTEIERERNLLNYLDRNKIGEYRENNFLISDLGKIKYIYRLNGIKRKGAALDDIIKYLYEKYGIKYISIYDFEWTITVEYLYKAVCILESNNDISFVYWNRRTVPIDYFHKIVGIYVDAFFELILPMKYLLDDVAMIHGSCGVIKVKDLINSGGFTPHLTEDASLTVRMYLNGYKGIYVREWIEYGQNLPPNFNMSIKTLRRWQSGTFDIIYRNFWKIIKSKKLKFKQKLSLIHMFTNFFSPILISFPLIILSIISVLFKISSNSWQYLYPIFYFIPFFIFLILLSEYYIVEKRIYGKGKILDAFLSLLIGWGISSLTIFYYLKRIFLGYESKWIVTKKKAIPYKIDGLVISIFIIMLTFNLYLLFYVLSSNIQYWNILSFFNLTIGSLSIYIWIFSLILLLFLTIYYIKYRKETKNLLFLGIKN